MLPRLLAGCKVAPGEYLELFKRAAAALRCFPNIIDVELSHKPLTVIGDIHGDARTFSNLLQQSGDGTVTLGDYVDRGQESIRSLGLAAASFLSEDAALTPLRGNHEDANMAAWYGARDEALAATDGDPVLWDAVCELFAALPVAAVLGGKVLAAHGGFGPGTTLDELARADRFVPAVPAGSPLIDVLWSDPSADASGFRASPRGAGALYSVGAVDAFLAREGLEALVRGHEAVAGVRVGPNPAVTTVHSTPALSAQRMGGVLDVTEGGVSARRFR